MKTSSTFHVLVLFATLLIFSMPFVLLAQTHSVQSQAVFDARQDAVASVNQGLWFMAGCFGTLLGYLGANTYHSPVPTVPLLGKSPEYVAFYTDTYVAKTRELQSTQAIMGCCIGASVQFIILFLTGNEYWLDL